MCIRDRDYSSRVEARIHTRRPPRAASPRWPPRSSSSSFGRWAPSRARSMTCLDRRARPRNVARDDATRRDTFRVVRVARVVRARRCRDRQSQRPLRRANDIAARAAARERRARKRSRENGGEKGTLSLARDESTRVDATRRARDDSSTPRARARWMPMPMKSRATTRDARWYARDDAPRRWNAGENILARHRGRREVVREVATTMDGWIRSRVVDTKRHPD